MLNLKKDYVEFRDYVLKKKYSYAHEKKLLLFGKKLSFYGYFNYKELMNVRSQINNDCYYKTIRAVCTFYEEKYIDDEYVKKELDKIKKIIKKPKSVPDIYTPSLDEVKRSLLELKQHSSSYAEFYFGLALSGVRITELSEVCNNISKYKTVAKNGFYKVVMNTTRNTKSSYFIYLPDWYTLPTKISTDYLRRLLNKNRSIIRPKYLRNFFYSICVELGISTAIADFYQGRTPITVGNKHYLEKEKHADTGYTLLIDYMKQLLEEP